MVCSHFFHDFDAINISFEMRVFLLLLFSLGLSVILSFSHMVSFVIVELEVKIIQLTNGNTDIESITQD